MSDYGDSWLVFAAWGPLCFLLGWAWGYICGRAFEQQRAAQSAVEGKQ